MKLTDKELDRAHQKISLHALAKRLKQRKPSDGLENLFADINKEEFESACKDLDVPVSEVIKRDSN